MTTKRKGPKTLAERGQLPQGAPLRHTQPQEIFTHTIYLPRPDTRRYVERQAYRSSQGERRRHSQLFTTTTLWSYWTLAWYRIKISYTVHLQRVSKTRIGSIVAIRLWKHELGEWEESHEWPWGNTHTSKGITRRIMNRFKEDCGLNTLQHLIEAIESVSAKPELSRYSRVPQSLTLRACPRCGGAVKRDSDQYGEYAQCMQCGRTA